MPADDTSQVARRHLQLDDSHTAPLRFPDTYCIGFSTISEAERLTGAELRIPEAEQGPLPNGTYYHHQLIGCDVVTEAGEALGRVSAVQGDGQATRLVVTGPKADVMIPLAAPICDVDVAAKRIVVNPPAGLLDVNGEWR